MVGPVEQVLLAVTVFAVMLGIGASLTPADFRDALRRPQALVIGVLSQFGFMPLIGFVLILALGLPEPSAIGLLIIACMPGGVMSNIFTFLSKGVVALSVMMTATSTVLGILLIPLLLHLYAGALDLEIPYENIMLTLVVLLIPLIIGMAIRTVSAMAAGAAETLGSVLSVLFIAFVVISWIPRNWQLFLSTPPSIFLAVILLGALGMLAGYRLARAVSLDARTARTVALETGIQNFPLAVAIVALSFPEDEQQPIIAIGALLSLYTVLASILVTVAFRRANRLQCSA